MSNFPTAFLPALGFFFFIFAGIGLVIAVLFILTLRKALEKCAPQNRATSPDSTWLLLIPLFNMIWGFILYPRISDSLEREFRQRNLPIEPQPAKSLGLALAILQICSIIPFLGFLAGIGALICFIMYWVKISGYSNRLNTGIVYDSQSGQPLQS
jgi:hypothetical protein